MAFTNRVTTRLSTPTVISMLVIFGLLLVSCTSDAERIRKANEAAASSDEATTTQSKEVIAPQATQIPNSANISVFEIRDGDCLQMFVPDAGAEFEETEIVNCNGNWDYKSLNSFVVEEDGIYPGDPFFHQQSISQCDRRYSISMFPSKESWALNDRTVSCLQASFGLDTTELEMLDSMINVSTVIEGECANHIPMSDYSMVELVDCQEDWDFLVVNTFSLSDGPFPGDVSIQSQADRHCGANANNFYPPTAESWQGIGDRLVICAYE